MNESYYNSVKYYSKKQLILSNILKNNRVGRVT